MAMAVAEDGDVIGVVTLEDDDKDLLKGCEQQALTSRERRWGVLLVIFSIADVAASGVIICIAVSHAYRDDGVSLYCLAIQALSHLLSSVLLAVRFLIECAMPQDAPGIGLDRGHVRKHRRAALVLEQSMSVFMGLTMLLSSVALLFKAFRKIKFWNKWYVDHMDLDKDVEEITMYLAWHAAAVYIVQAFVRFLVARQVHREIIWHAFVVSGVSLTFLVVLAVAATEEKEWSWKAEPIAAMLLSFVTLGEGIRIIYYHFDDVDARLNRNPQA
jgi:hypothetical protein